jgi:hypothetical protein
MQPTCAGDSDPTPVPMSPRVPTPHCGGIPIFIIRPPQPADLENSMFWRKVLFQPTCPILNRCSLSVAVRGYRYAQWAREMENQSVSIKNTSKGDAYRHCIWSCRMQAEWDNDITTSRCAKVLGDCHEKWMPTDAASHAMDYHNNAMGRRAGSICRGTDTGACCMSVCSSMLNNGLIIKKGDPPVSTPSPDMVIPLEPLNQ